MKRILFVVLGQIVVMALVIMPLAAQNTISPVEQLALLKDVQSAINSFNVLTSFSLSGRIQTSQQLYFQENMEESPKITSRFELKTLNSNVMYDADHQPYIQGNIDIHSAAASPVLSATDLMYSFTFPQQYVIIADDIYVNLIQSSIYPQGWIKNPNTNIVPEGRPITVDWYANFGLEYLQYPLDLKTIQYIEELPSKETAHGRMQIIKVTFNGATLFNDGLLGDIESVVKETGLDRETIATVFGQNTIFEIRYWIGEDDLILRRFDVVWYFNSNLEGVSGFDMTYPNFWLEQSVMASFMFTDFNKNFNIEAPI
jgi:hypothetical protein